MTENNLLERKERRLQGLYPVRKPVYLQGYISVGEALNALNAFGEILFIQECSKGRRKTIWDRRTGMNELEKAVSIYGRK